MIAESDATGAVIREYIWLGSLPIALVDHSGGTATLFFIHADHLGAPQKVSDAAKAVVWSGQFEPFGEVQGVTGALTQLLMFPGQYYDSETGTAQNWHRQYDARTGRYLEADPLGLGGGANLYAYVGGNPLGRVDPEGRAGALPVPFGPLPIFLPPIAVPGSPENQAWVQWTLHQVNDACERLGFRNEADAEINGSGPLEARGFPTGVWPADKGSEEWGRRNGVGKDEGRRRFHDIKNSDKGSRPKDVYGVDPESGEVYNPEGEVVGKLDGGKRK